MNINGQMSRLLLLSCLLIVTGSLYAQNLPDSFLTGQANQYRSWLQSKNLHRYLKVDTLEQNEEGITLHLKADGLKNWQNLAHYLDSACSLSLSEILFNRLLFQLDYAPCRIITDTRDANVRIVQVNNRVNTDIRKTLGPTDPLSDYAFHDLINLFEVKPIESSKDIGVIKKLILVNLEKDFDKKSARFVKCKFSNLTQDDSTLILEISNVVNVVINKGYLFEHLRLFFTFRKAAKGSTIKYEMDGKYAGGIIWSPQDSRYYPMLPKYQQQVDHFNMEMRSRIYQLVN